MLCVSADDAGGITLQLDRAYSQFRGNVVKGRSWETTFRNFLSQRKRFASFPFDFSEVNNMLIEFSKAIVRSDSSSFPTTTTTTAALTTPRRRSLYLSKLHLNVLPKVASKKTRLFARALVFTNPALTEVTLHLLLLSTNSTAKLIEGLKNGCAQLTRFDVLGITSFIQTVFVSELVAHSPSLQFFSIVTDCHQLSVCKVLFNNLLRLEHIHRFEVRSRPCGCGKGSELGTIEANFVRELAGWQHRIGRTHYLKLPCPLDLKLSDSKREVQTKE